MKSFEEKVLDIVARIPRGKVTTYGHIARAAGTARGARMVGWILNRQKFNPAVPAHRVVNRRGQLTGRWYFETPDLMARLLQNEGIPVHDHCVTDLKNYLWIPETADE
ncbi:MAG: MGMT family protein [Chlorobi bacterium]|nr:MGMT family protein [Chlorobiota bacterium]